MKKIITWMSVVLPVFHSVATHAEGSFEQYGDIGQFAIPVTAGVISLYKDDTDGFRSLALSTITSTVAVQILKQTVHERRPNGGQHSFPSGHTGFAFSGASYLQRRYGWEYGVPAYIAAGAVGWSRVNAKKHYWHDVIAAATISIGVNYYFTDPQDGDHQLSLTPMIGDKGEVGLAFNYKF